MTATSGGRVDSRATTITLAATEHCLPRAERLAASLPALVAPGARAAAVPLAGGAAVLDGTTVLAVLMDSRDVPQGLSELLDAAEESRIGVLMLVDAQGRRAPSAGARRPCCLLYTSDAAAKRIV